MIKNAYIQEKRISHSALNVVLICCAVVAKHIFISMALNSHFIFGVVIVFQAVLEKIHTIFKRRENEMILSQPHITFFWQNKIG